MESRPLNPEILLWADVTHIDMDEIDNTESTTELKRVLCKVLGVQVNHSRMRVMLDVYLHALQFSRKVGLTREQISVLFSIIKAIHGANIQTQLNNIDLCFTFCKELLLCHSARRPPFSIDLFSSEQVTEILQYLATTYFRHYALYKYIFTAKVELDLSLSYSEMPGDKESEDLETQ